MQRFTETSELLRSLDDLFPLITAAQPGFDSGGRLPDDLAQSLATAGVFNMCVPKTLGGAEVEPLEMMEIVERLSFADGAVGWVTAIAAGTAGYLSARLPEATASAMWSGRNTVMCGSIAVVGGSATPAQGGYRISGRWAFGSGSYNSDWLASACAVKKDSAGAGTEPATPEELIVVLRQSDCEILDTWDSVGLRGTGSTDYVANDVFVPAEHTMGRRAEPIRGDRFYRQRFHLLAHGAHALGIARRALTTFDELACAKPDGRADRVLAGRPAVQSDRAEAHALVAMAHAYLRETVAELSDTVRAGGAWSLAQQGEGRLAVVSAVRNAVRAIDILYEAAGASSVYERSPLARCFRDIHVASQHAVVQRASYVVAGQTLLGISPAVPFVL